MNQEQLKYQIAITLIPGVGNVVGKNLIGYCGSEEAVFCEKKTRLIKVPEIGPVTADAIINNKNKAFERAEKEIKFIEKYKITPLFYLNQDYPQRLKNCNDAPLMLYYKGNANLNSGKIISIVGTRSATEYGKEICNRLTEALLPLNVLIVSGLAYGIDICAHKSAVKYGLPTVGILAHGLDKIYPAVHKNTAKKMIENGGLLTEFPSETNPDRENFPQRNRIIAGICDAVIVIEAAKNGGALITADIANSYNRDVFAVPGRVNDTYSEGCNNLIRTNKAALLQSAKDIEYLMGWQQHDNNDKNRQKNIQKKLFIEMKPEEKKVIDLLNEKGKMDIDSLCLRSQLATSKAASALLNLEFAGIVKSLPGKMYQLT